MNKSQEKMLENLGWTVECESPLEIRHQDNSFLTGMKAKEYIQFLEKEQISAKEQLEKGIIEEILSYEEETGKIIECVYFEAEKKEKFSFNGEKFVQMENGHIVSLAKEDNLFEGTIDSLIVDLLELKSLYGGEKSIGISQYNGGNDIVVGLTKEHHYEDSGKIVLGTKHIF